MLMGSTWSTGKSYPRTVTRMMIQVNLEVRTAKREIDQVLKRYH